ncbi:MAG: NADase-type glycan-binding domain-containing protein [Nocardioides sp.]
METCARCGAPLGVGRFCVNCGHPVDAPVGEPVPVEAFDEWRTGTAERPAVPADDTHRTEPDVEPTVPVPRPDLAPPPAAYVPDHGPRFPLFADQVPEGAPLASPPAAGGHAHSHAQPRRDWLPWAVGAAALLLVVVLVVALLTRGDDSPVAAPARTPSTPAASTPAPSTSPRPTRSAPAGTPEDVAKDATVTVPATAPPNQDVAGHGVRYDARNMLDGIPETCWRMPGDGTGREIRLRLAGPTVIDQVGLINGYAKTATDAQGRTLDWYHGNRRVLRVAWVFDDGTTITQDLTDTRGLQTLKVDGVRTRTVTIRLDSVSTPGTGRARRDYTPISDVSLVGVRG